MKAVLLAVLSGLMLTAGFPKPSLFFVSWMALVPLLLALRGKSAKRAFLLGYVCGVVHYLTVLYWIRHAIYYYGGINYFLSNLILILLCLMLALYPAVFALVAQRFARRPALFVFALPFAWVTVVEFAMTFTPFSGFPWTALGYTQTPWNRLIQAADITGVYGISWLVVFASTAVCGFIQNRFRKTAVPVLAVCIVAALAYGTWRIADVKAAQQAVPPFKVSIVQADVKQSVLWDPTSLTDTFQRYAQLSDDAVKAAPDTDLLFWPESAMPFFYGIDENYTKEANEIVRRAGKPVLFGSSGVTRVDGKPRLLNRAYLLNGDAQILGAYAKQHLVPFGEYVPLKKYLFFVKHLVVGDVDFVAGTDPGPIYLDGHALGVLICYEVVFPSIPREEVRRGARVLLNMTNDAWYGDTGGPYQHLEISRWRAIESRVPLVRAANTGVSAAFDATGAEMGRIPLNTAGFLTVTVHPMRYLSFYTRFGDIFAWLSVVVTFLGVVFSYLGSEEIKP
jgi:apolipoprotein N-acyltransferase